MKKLSLGIVGMVGFIYCGLNYAYTCPDPHTTSLKWGIVPEPWQVNPFSAHDPQGDDATRFVRANILVATYGQGVLCTYRMSIGDYSIWWPILTKIPSPMDYSWIDAPGGFVCTRGVDLCRFEVAAELP
jgi:hypothetical protein